MFFMYRNMQGAGNRAFQFGRSKAKRYEEGKQKITFADVAGQKDAKYELEEVVDFLKSHPQVENVNHPALPSHRDHALYKRYFPNGAGSIFSFELKGDSEKAKVFTEKLQLFSLLANVADVKSLVIHPASTTHSQMTEKELLGSGIKPNTIRLSIGTEHIDDIIDDLKYGLG
jgi:O-acetylhomoserine (thiol)-lyase